MYLPIVVSTIGLIVSIATFFLVQIRPAKISLYLGPFGIIGYPSGGGLGILIPATFTNHGARTGIVVRSAVTLHRKEAPQERYFMQWDSFQKRDFATNAMVPDESAGSIAIPAKSIISKQISFGWRNTTNPQIRLSRGTYLISYYFWTSDAKHPYCEVRDIYINDEMLAILEAPIDSINKQSIQIDLEKKFEINAVMNEFEVRERLG